MCSPSQDTENSLSALISERFAHIISNVCLPISYFENLQNMLVLLKHPFHAWEMQFNFCQIAFPVILNIFNTQVYIIPVYTKSAKICIPPSCLGYSQRCLLSFSKAGAGGSLKTQMLFWIRFQIWSHWKCLRVCFWSDRGLRALLCNLRDLRYRSQISHL